MLRTLAAVVLLVGAVVGQYVTRSSPPRFKQSVRRHQYTYLGDTAKFKCDAVGRPMPKAHWYRNGVYANYSFMQERPRIQEKGMELEIRRVEVGDKGQWACRVWNSEGSIMRNFTLHIIDYCDFYLTSEAEATNAVTSESCLCEWISTDDPAFDDDNEILDFRDKYCPKYEKENEVTKFRTTAQLSPCRTPNCEDEDVEQYLKSFHRRSEKDPAGEDSSARDFVVPAMSASHYPINTPLDTEQKLQRARAILKERIPVLRQQHDEGIRTDVDEFEEGDYGALKQDRFVAQADTQPTDEGFAGELVDSMREPQAQALVSSGGEASSDPAAEMTTTRRWSPIWTTRSWKPPAVPAKVAPYFRQTDEQTTIVVPSGRTLRLNCKAGGIPEPQVIWRKDHVEISTDTERKSGSIYRIRKWSLELEDAAEGDSGHYTCDVFNSIGSIRRDFRVDVRDRIRARPIILPNVLVNKTVDVNGTVNFTCQVLSDLVPHVVWIRLVRLNGSYIRWDERQNRNVFNFIDMSTVKKAHIFHDNQSKQYSLLIRNVSVEDQGIYSCVAGSSLGISMANASLTVNEFRGMTLPTDHPGPSWHFIYTLFLVLLIMSLICCFTLAAMYYFFNKRVRKDGLQNMEKMTVRKKVVITKKPKEGDVWSDLASSYTITVEPVLGKGQSNRTRVNSEMSLVSEYEVPTDVAYEIDRSRLTLVDIIGEGAFGEVWRGELRPKGSSDDQAADETRPLNEDHSIAVAVKKLKPSAQEKELIILVSEMQIFKSIGRHKNILKLVGCCTGTGPLLVVLELCPHGNLRDFLRRHRPHGAETEEDSQSGTPVTRKSTGESHTPTIHNLTLRDLVRFATEIACGMEFLSSKKIIHRDLAARNILVAHDFSAKISDFGLSRNVFCQDYYRKRGAGRLPIKWMAPEALEANVYTVYSDVWSYGIVLWEIMTLGGTPYPTIAMPQLYNLLKEGYRMEAPHNCPEEIYGVMVMCWQERPESRPQFQTICDYLEWIVQEAMRMNTAGIDDHYMGTEDGVQTTLNGNEDRRLSRPLSAPGLRSIQSFARGLSNAVNEDGDRRMHESTPLLMGHQLHPQHEHKAQGLAKHSAKSSLEWDGLFDFGRLDSVKTKRSMDRLEHSTHNNSQTIYTMPLLNSIPSASTSEHNQTSLSNTETDYHEAIPYANIHEYMNDHKRQNGETSAGSTSNPNKQLPPHKLSARFPSLNIPKLSDSSTNLDDSKNVYEVIGNGHLKNEQDEKKPQMPRSQSVDSQSSSGRGGSSAMSSAEGLGAIAEFSQLQLPLNENGTHSSDSKTP